MRRVIYAIFCLIFLLSQACLAQVTAKPETGSSIKQLTKVRWALYSDAVTGGRKVRLVFDVTGPVAAEGSVTGTPTPRLVVNVKGAVWDYSSNRVALDGQIANGLSITSADGRNSVITITMPLMIDDSNCKVFTMPAVPTAGKPFRVVVDIGRPVPPPTFHYTPGLLNKVIAIDPGHGGSDAGAVGFAGIQEKKVNLAVALKVKALLEQAGAKVVMTRMTDTDVYSCDSTAAEELNARTAIANLRKVDLFLSIHSNSSVSRSAEGTATFYYKKTRYDDILARDLQSSLVQTSGRLDRGSFPANFYVLKHTVMPASLVEMAFISNPEEEKLLASRAFQQEIAQGIVQGIAKFFDEVGE